MNAEQTSPGDLVALLAELPGYGQVRIECRPSLGGAGSRVLVLATTFPVTGWQEWIPLIPEEEHLTDDPAARVGRSTLRYLEEESRT